MHAAPDISLNDVSAINVILGADELLQIFDLLTPKELLATAALVCSRWASIARSNAAWQSRLPEAEWAALRESCKVLQALPLRRIFPLLLPSNLLRDSLLQQAAQQAVKLVFSYAATSTWVWQTPVVGWHCRTGRIPRRLSWWPPGALHLPAPGEQHSPTEDRHGTVPFPYWCKLMQHVDLVAALKARGFDEAEAAHILNGNAPLPLEFSVCIATDCDCGNVRAEVMVELSTCRPPPPPPPTVWRIGEPSSWSRFAQRPETWVSGRLNPEPGTWHSITACLQGYPKRMRWAAVYFRADGTENIPGHNGMKFAVPHLRVLTPSELPCALERHGHLRRLPDPVVVPIQ